MARLTPLFLALLFAEASTTPAHAQTKVERTVSFSFEKKPWGEVIDWFRNESGLVYAGTVTPTGSITIKPPAGKKYTIPQVVDLLNELLEPRYVLVRREQTFTVLPADEPIESSQARMLQDEAELASLGRTEVVQLVAPLVPLTPDEVVPPLKFLLSSFGRIAPFGSTAIVVRDKAINVRQVVDAIAKLKRDTDRNRSRYACKYVRASAAAESLKTLLGEESVLVTAVPTASPGPSSRAERPQPPGKAVRISVQESTNSVLMTGPADKLAIARAFLSEDIDRGMPGTELHPGGEQTFREYPVAPGTAAAVAATLQARFQNASVVINPAGTDRISVFGYPMDHTAIARQVLADNPDARGDPVTEIVPVFTCDPKAMASLMTKMFPAANGLPLIEPQYDGAKTGVLVRAGGEQVKRIRKEIQAIDNPDGRAESARFQSVFLPGSTGSGILAECLADMVKQSARNDVIVLDPTAPPEKARVKPREVRRRKPPVEPPAATRPMREPDSPDRIDPGMSRPLQLFPRVPGK
ncbi:MAG TPA: secretin N-terminal domain-containing protein [Fimbriiglobus sp.]|jgi:hypothetical protein